MFKQKTLPLILVLLLVGHLALPFADASSTSGRAGPDFRVTSMKFDGAGSVIVGSALILAPDTHTVRINVENVGTSSGKAFLSLVHTKALRTLPSRLWILSTLAPWLRVQERPPICLAGQALQAHLKLFLPE